MLKLEPETSNVTEIELQKSSVDPKDMVLLLSGMRFLKKFIYDHDASLTCNEDDQLSDILMVLKSYAANTLELLALPVNDSLTRCAGGTHKGGNALKDFRALREVRVPCNLFLRDEALHQGSHDELKVKDWLDDIPRLADILPASIEKIEMDGEITMTSVESLLIGLNADSPDYKRQKVPNLKEIVFHEAKTETETAEMMAKAWKDGLRDSGINLQS